MAGTIPLSLTQQLDKFGAPLAGGRLYIFQAGTVSTPQNGFQDSALTLPWPNPIILDASGRLPQFFLADGSIKVRLTDKDGVEQFVQDGIIVTGASSGGGGGSPVDATTILATGDIKPRYGTGTLTGFVRLNGRTIGSVTSGATERANADCDPLFEYLWNADASLVVSTGRGATANADWVANKTITLPDFRSRALAALGDMGNTDNGLFVGVAFTTGASTILGSTVGATRKTLTVAQIPSITSQNSGIISATTAGSTSVPQNPTLSNAYGTGSSPGYVPGALGALVSTMAPGVVQVTSNNTFGNTFDNVSPYALITIYCKL